MSYLKCPICREDLVLKMDECISLSRKIKKDGNLHKVINKSERGRVLGTPYLSCSSIYCDFTYDVEHRSQDKPIKEIDDWIFEHLEEIYEF